MKEIVFDIIEAQFTLDKDSKQANLSKVYDWFMIVVILLSLLPLTIKGTTPFYNALDYITAVIFIIDYGLRWWTSPLKVKKGRASYVLYPFTFMAILDLLSILPTVIGPMSYTFKAVRVLRLLRAMRVLRTFKLLRYSKSLHTLTSVMRRQQEPLTAVLCLLMGYIMISALIVFNVEPESFKSFGEAIYWATVSLTTVGYGDIAPVTTVGRVVTIISSIFGIVIVALPSGIITAGYLEEIGMYEKRERDKGDKADEQSN